MKFSFFECRLSHNMLLNQLGVAYFRFVQNNSVSDFFQ
uniref:Uncharacterized protein n=1 Tax=Arundo donax TaxID=35708 RepID=A0A0A9DUW1_ARUDO